MRRILPRVHALLAIPLLLATPDAGAGFACAVEADVGVGETYQATAEGEEERDTLAKAWGELCRVLAADGLACEVRTQVKALITRRSTRYAMINGKMERAYTLELAARYIRQGAGTGRGPTRDAACTAALLGACEAAAAPCPRGDADLRTVDGEPVPPRARNIIHGDSSDPRDRLKQIGATP